MAIPNDSVWPFGEVEVVEHQNRKPLRTAMEHVDLDECPLLSPLPSCLYSSELGSGPTC